MRFANLSDPPLPPRRHRVPCPDCVVHLPTRALLALPSSKLQVNDLPPLSCPLLPSCRAPPFCRFLETMAPLPKAESDLQAEAASLAADRAEEKLAEVMSGAEVSQARVKELEEALEAASRDLTVRILYLPSLPTIPRHLPPYCIPASPALISLPHCLPRSPGCFAFSAPVCLRPLDEPPSSSRDPPANFSSLPLPRGHGSNSSFLLLDPLSCLPAFLAPTPSPLPFFPRGLAAVPTGSSASVPLEPTRL